MELKLMGLKYASDTELMGLKYTPDIELLLMGRQV